MEIFNNSKISIPKYLEELVKPTPLSVAKLLAAWDGLSDETKIMIIDQHVSLYPIDYKLKICLTAIKSSNVYLRHLAHEIARNVLDFNTAAETSELLKNIKLIGESDESKLVSGSNVVIFGLKCTPDEFFNFSDIQRIYNISRVRGNGKQVSEFIQYYYQNRIKFPHVSENNIYDILCQYLSGNGFNEYKSNEMSYDGYTEFSKGEDVSALWNLIGTVNEKIAYLLIQNLPSESGFRSFTKDVIPNLPEKYLIWFLTNKNNYASDFRKSIFTSDSYSKNVKEAAVSCNFSLMDYEFLEIVKTEPKKRHSILEDLVFADDLSVCMKKAIIDLLKIETSVDFMLIRCCEQGINRKLRKLSPEHQQYHLNVIRIYEIAKRILPWNQLEPRQINFPSDVDFLQINTKGLNTWEIFIRMRDGYERVYNNEEISLRLAEMVDLDEEKDLPKDSHDTFLLKRILKAQSEIFVKTKQPKQPNYIEKEINSINENIKPVADIIEKQVNQIRITNERIDNFGNEIKFLKDRLTTYSNIVLIFILIYTIIEISEKFFGFNFIKFFRGFVI